MANHLRFDVFRPDVCPDGHRGRIWLHGNYSKWSNAHAKQQYRCEPKGAKRHKFTLLLPPRQPTKHNPSSGQACEHCERGYREGEGPACGHQFMFTMRESAKSLALVGQGRSLRDTGHEVRRGALRAKQAARPAQRRAQLKVPRRRTSARTSREANIVADYIDVFAPTVLAELRADGDLPTNWPRSLAVDSFGLKTRLWSGGVSIPPGRDAGEIYLAMGTDTPNGEPIPIAMTLMGGKDHLSVLDFFATVAGAPEWVVTDDDPGLEKAIAIAWPTAVHYRCEAHLLNLAKKAFKEDKLYRLKVWGQRLGKAIEKAQHSDQRFDELKRMAARLEHLRPGLTTNLGTWIVSYEMLIKHQVGLRLAHPGMTRSVGAVEAQLQWVDDQIRDRHGGWRNLARVNSVLALMLAHRSGVASETRYLHIIRRLLERNGGKTGLRSAADYKRFRDRVGKSSLRALLAFADQRQLAAAQAAQSQVAKARIGRQAARTSATLVSQGLAPVPTFGHHKRPGGRTRVLVKGMRVSQFPAVAAEWHPTRNLPKTPEKTWAGSDKEAFWQCAKGHEWPAVINKRTRLGDRCPFCTNRKVDPSNSLATLRPDLAAEWDTSRNTFGPDTVSIGSGKEAWWVCSTCGHSWHTKIFARGLQTQGCPNWQKVQHPDGRKHLPNNQQRRRREQRITDAEAAPLDPPALDPPEAIKDDHDFPFD